MGRYQHVTCIAHGARLQHNCEYPPSAAAADAISSLCVCTSNGAAVPKQVCKAAVTPFLAHRGAAAAVPSGDISFVLSHTAPASALHRIRVDASLRMLRSM